MGPTVHLQGWILNLYPTPHGRTLWLIDANQKRHRLTDRFAPTFYVRDCPQASSGWSRRYKDSQPISPADSPSAPTYGKTARCLCWKSWWPVRHFLSWVRWVHGFDSRLLLFDSDLMFESPYCWHHSLFPLARAGVETDAAGKRLYAQMPR
jgi:hypothetical protein